jgi:hypothetical protein
MVTLVLSEIPSGLLIDRIVSGISLWDHRQLLVRRQHQLLLQKSPRLRHQAVHHSSEIGHAELDLLVQYRVSAPIDMSFGCRVEVDLHLIRP